MTEITLKIVEKIAKLARIEVSEEKKQKYTKDLQNIFHMIDALNEPDTSNVEPFTGVGSYTLRTREDVINDGNIQEQILKNAPKNQYGCFVVPKVVGE
jgi:aspartyl-tRNA(Asn)/glutamyl-tRNA(Gln) amidotransferase subunit C